MENNIYDHYKNKNEQGKTLTEKEIKSIIY